MKYALLSVSDTTGLIPFARMLRSKGYTIIATKGTGQKLHAGRIPSVPVEEFTSSPVLFGGRIKTLHPRLLGGILFRRTKDTQEARKYHIPPIDLVVTNLYPFAEKPTIENIDIGGVTLLRSAAKNHDAVTVICDPEDYKEVASEILERDTISPQTRKRLAIKAFSKTAVYDTTITRAFSRQSNLRYGENPHQQGWFYPHVEKTWTQLQGKELSYCNLLDADAAWNLVAENAQPTAACIKHATPCGVASHSNITEAFQRSFDADPLSAFGVVVGLNRACTADIIQKMMNQKIFVEVMIAPAFDHDALILLRERPNVRVIAIQKSEIPFGVAQDRLHPKSEMIRSVLGGILVQTPNTSILTKRDLRCMTKKQPTPAQIKDLLFAWNVVKHALSNAIVLTKNQTTVGIGSGQTSRIDAVNCAAQKAHRCGHTLTGAVMASDAFFPFPDSVEEAARLGVSAIIQPGGSKRDQEILAKADKLGLAMVFTGIRAFRH